MRKLINLPSGSGKTYSFQALASEGYAIIDLDAFVFKTNMLIQRILLSKVRIIHLSFSM